MQDRNLFYLLLGTAMLLAIPWGERKARADDFDFPVALQLEISKSLVETGEAVAFQETAVAGSNYRFVSVSHECLRVGEYHPKSKTFALWKSNLAFEGFNRGLDSWPDLPMHKKVDHDEGATAKNIAGQMTRTFSSQVNDPGIYAVRASWHYFKNGNFTRNSIHFNTILVIVTPDAGYFERVKTTPLRESRYIADGISYSGRSLQSQLSVHFEKKSFDKKSPFSLFGISEVKSD